MTYIGGKILKKTSNEISILKDEEIIKTITINEDGEFFSKIDSIKDGLYNFIHLPEFQYLILEKGDSIVLRLDVLDFDESLVFTGKGSSKNNYLIDIFLKHEQETDFIKSKFKSNESGFIRTIDSLLELKLDEFLKFKKSNKINQSSEVVLEYAIKLPLYLNVEYFISNFSSSINSENIYKYRRIIDLNIEALSHFKPYLDYIILRTINGSNLLLRNVTQSSLNFNLKRLEFVNSNITHPVIKTKILRYIAYEYLLKESELINIDTFFNKFLEYSNNEETNYEINHLYNNIISLQVGNKIPKINLINEKGIIKDIAEFNNNKSVIFVFWSYDQNSHQISLFNRINNLLKTNSIYNIHTININTDNFKWKKILSMLKKKANLNHFRSVNFEDMSRKMILNNLNKVIITDKKGEIKKILNVTELDKLFDLY
tara:strand:- start:1476 stop:2762 length:1287 start_codon:yes stop_codon:yes gene_type:complete